jgi:hypothetical protein
MRLVTESPKHLMAFTTIHIADTKSCSVAFNSEQVEKLVSKRQSAPLAVATPTVVAPSNLAETAGPHIVSSRNWPNSVPYGNFPMLVNIISCANAWAQMAAAVGTSMPFLVA